MSLRDQLLKAGVASKKQAKKAASEAKLEKRKKNKQKKAKGTPQEKDEIQLELEKKRVAQKERDRELNKAREEQRQIHEMRARISNIINSGAIYDLKADVDYFFLVNDTVIKKVRVNEEQMTKLSKGLLGIVEWNEDFHILTQDKCSKISEFMPHAIRCLHKDA